METAALARSRGQLDRLLDSLAARSFLLRDCHHLDQLQMTRNTRALAEFVHGKNALHSA